MYPLPNTENPNPTDNTNPPDLSGIQLQFPNLNMPPPSGSATVNNSNRVIATAELENLVTNIVSRVCKEQCKDIVQTIINPHANFYKGIEQTIDAQYSGNLNDLDKVPDVVRTLREFSGNPGKYSSSRKSVERILNIYNNLKGSPKYFGILNTIRNKIVGNADAVLESYNTPLNWECISKCLTTHYADKRDLGTLEYQMTTLTQSHNTVEQYYQMVYQHLSLILNKISSMNISTDAMHLLTETYRDKALDTFIRGLRGDLPRLLGIREPVDLPQALYLCLENQNFRSQHANIPNKKPIPELPSRRPAPATQQQQFFPHLAHIPQYPPQRSHYPQNSQYPQYPQQFQQRYQYPQQNVFQPQKQYVPPRPTAPKPFPRPVPMEIDHSMRSRAVNYMNRPKPHNPLFGKRPNEQNISSPSLQAHPPKAQRNFHVSTTPVTSYPYPESVNNPDFEQGTDQINMVSNNVYPDQPDINSYNSLLNSMNEIEIGDESLEESILQTKTTTMNNLMIMQVEF